MYFLIEQKDVKVTLWRTASLRSAPQAAHIKTSLCCLDNSYDVLGNTVLCEPNMYSYLCTEIYLSLSTALD